MATEQLTQNSLKPWDTIAQALAPLRAEMSLNDPVLISAAAHHSGIRSTRARQIRTGITNKALHSETAQALFEVDTNNENAIERLAALGYQRLRHLRAQGLTFHEIGRDLGINVNNIIEFMRMAPTALEDAQQDEESCADARTLKLEDYVRNEPILNKNDTVRMQLLTNIQLEMNKRLSAKWAKGTADPQDQLAEEAAKGSTITMIINNSPDKDTSIVAEYKSGDAQQYKEMDAPEKEESAFEMSLPGL